MKLSNYFSMLLMPALAIVGCTKPDIEDPGEKGQLTIVATTDGTIVPQWNASDEISVVCADEMYTFITEDNKKTAEFTEAEKRLTSEIIGSNPVSAYFNCASMYGTFRIQAEQKYENGASSAKIPMYAYTMNTPENNVLAMSFKPLASVLSLVIQPYDMNVEKITVAPAADATVSYGALAGGFVADASKGTVTVTNEINSVVLNFTSPKSLKEGATVNIPVGWFAVEGGLTITMTYDGTKEYTFTIWADGGVVKSFSDEGGIKTSRMITETLEFDANAFPRAYYVKTGASADSKGLSWDAPTTLSAALENAVAGSTIHIAAGTYRPESHVKYMQGAGDAAVELPAEEGFKTFAVSKNITIIGGYPANAVAGAVPGTSNSTILDGGNSSYHTMIVGAPEIAGEKTVIEGITITGGANTELQKDIYTVLNGHKIAGNYAAGLAVVGKNVELKNVYVTGNGGHSAAGMYCFDTNIRMSGCTVSNNVSVGNGGGAWFTTGTVLEMDGCEISGNSTTGGIVGGLYLYVPAEARMSANISNTVIADNTSAKNIGGVYVRDDSDNFGLVSSFSGCQISGNTGAMGAAVAVLNAKSSFRDCVFTGNEAPGNGVIYVNTSNALSADVVFDGCEVSDNKTLNSGNVGAGIYAYNNGDKLDMNIVDCAFYGNEALGRGGALYARNNQAGALTVRCANSTFADNTAGSWGGAINVFGAAAKPCTVDLISCTVYDNHNTNTAYPGGISLETAGAVVNTFNTLIAGNKTIDDITDVVVKSGITAVVNHRNTIVGDKYFNASGAETAVTPVFDCNTMVNAIADNGGNTWTCRLLGNAQNNPAFGNGMTATELKTLANDYISAEILSKDQIGNARSDSDRIIGACVIK